MLNSFVCGTSNLPEEEHDIEELLGPCSKSTLKKKKKIKDSNNPYANRGLDKFSALLDELESKKQKIYTQKGSNDISFVRFVYSSSNDWEPIVVKAKERKQEQNQVQKKKFIISTAISEEKNKHILIDEGFAQEIKRNGKGNGRRRSRLNFKMEIFLKDMGLMIVMILLFLVVVFGKTLAIFCSSFGWYFFKMIKDSSRQKNSSSTRISSASDVNKPQSKISLQNVSLISSSGLDKPKYKRSLQSSSSSSSSSSGSDKPKSKKNYGIIVTKELTSPRSVLGALDEELPGRHAHRKSW